MRDDLEIKNAKIESTTLGFEDHGIMTAWIHLNYGGSGQGFGGWSFDTYDEKRKERVGCSYGAEFVRRLLKTVGVDRWEKLPGTPIRVEASMSKVFRIGHLLEDVWFDPKELSEEMGFK